MQNKFSIIIKPLAVTLLCFLPLHEARAQARASVYFDIGSTQVSEGWFFKTSPMLNYRFGKNEIEGGLQIDAISNNLSFLSGYKFNASRQFRIREFPFDLSGFYLGTRYSDVVREGNWGLILAFQRTHLAMRLGSNFRTLSFTRDAMDHFGYDENTRIRENFNLMYSFSYSLKPTDHPWNIACTMTNIDHYIISQETNPAFNIMGHYRVSPTLDLFLESWYKSAGALNLSVNYFGFFFRGGMVWNIL